MNTAITLMTLISTIGISFGCFSIYFLKLAINDKCINSSLISTLLMCMCGILIYIPYNYFFNEISSQQYNDLSILTKNIDKEINMQIIISLNDDRITHYEITKIYDLYSQCRENMVYKNAKDTLKKKLNYVNKN